MNIHLLAIGKRMPNWVEQAYEEYTKRLPKECQLKLIELDMPKRSKTTNIEKIIQQEALALQSAIPKGSLVVALDQRGRQYDTPQLAQQLKHWLESGQDVSLLVGGPDGLAQQCLTQANQVWSLSNLTLPHPLVRVILAEQIYRSWSILSHHPYHRD